MPVLYDGKQIIPAPFVSYKRELQKNPQRLLFEEQRENDSISVRLQQRKQ